MSLAVAIQMDPISGINIETDSTFMLALEGQKRGHGLFHYVPQDLSFRNGRLFARIQPGVHCSRCGSGKHTTSRGTGIRSPLDIPRASTQSRGVWSATKGLVSPEIPRVTWGTPSSTAVAERCETGAWARSACQSSIASIAAEILASSKV